MSTRGRASFRSRMPQSSYYQNNKQGAALQRARRAYLLPNIVTGIAIFGFAIGVYAFTIRAVSQDEFEDVPVPSGPIQPSRGPNTAINAAAGTNAVSK